MYLSLGRHNAALDDFDAIIRLYPAFGQVGPGSKGCLSGFLLTVGVGSLPESKDPSEGGTIRRGSSRVEGVWQGQEAGSRCGGSGEAFSQLVLARY